MKVSIKLFALSLMLLLVSGAQASSSTVAPAVCVAQKAASSELWSAAGENVKAAFSNIGSALGSAFEKLWSYAPGAAKQVTSEIRILTAALPQCPITTLVVVGMASYCAYKTYNYAANNNTNSVAGLRQRIQAALGR